MKKTALYITMLFIPLLGMSQSELPSPMVVKKARVSVYQWLKGYDAYASLSSRRNQKSFSALFAGDSVLIFNDYLPDKRHTDHPDISVKAYCDLFRSSTSWNCRCEITDFKINREYLKDRGICYDIQFKKKIWFEKADSAYKYEDSLLYESELYYNPKNDSIKARYLHAHYLRLFVDNDKGKGKDKETGHTGDAFHPNSPAFCSDNIFSVGLTLGVHTSTPVYQNKAMFSDYGGGPGLNFGGFVQYDRCLWMGNNNRLGMDFGVLCRKSVSNWHFNFFDQFESVDEDGCDYRRIISLKNYREKLSRTSLGLPVGFRYDRFFKTANNRYCSVFGKAGAMLMHDLSVNSDITAKVTCKGYYKDLFGVTMDQNGIYDFGVYDISVHHTGSPYFTRQFSVDAYVFAGMCFSLSDRFSIEGSVGFQKNVFFTSEYLNEKADDTFQRSIANGDCVSSMYAMEKDSAKDLNFNIQLNFNF